MMMYSEELVVNTIPAILQNGCFVPKVRPDWTEGAEVEVTLHDEAEGIFEDTPESIARWVALAESNPGLPVSDEEWSANQSRRQEDRAWEFAQTAAREKIFDPESA